MNKRTTPWSIAIAICFFLLSAGIPVSHQSVTAHSVYSTSCLNAIYYWETVGLFADKVINYNGTYI